MSLFGARMRTEARLMLQVKNEFEGKENKKKDKKPT
jgi:hypothetical protein